MLLSQFKCETAYHLIENLNNPIFKPVRQLLYDYHRRGLDIMTEKKDDAINFEVTVDFQKTMAY